MATRVCPHCGKETRHIPVPGTLSGSDWCQTHGWVNAQSPVPVPPRIEKES